MMLRFTLYQGKSEDHNGIRPSLNNYPTLRYGIRYMSLT